MVRAGRRAFLPPELDLAEDVVQQILQEPLEVGLHVRGREVPDGSERRLSHVSSVADGVKLLGFARRQRQEVVRQPRDVGRDQRGFAGHGVRDRRHVRADGHLVPQVAEADGHLLVVVVAVRAPDELLQASLEHDADEAPDCDGQREAADDRVRPAGQLLGRRSLPGFVLSIGRRADQELAQTMPCRDRRSVTIAGPERFFSTHERPGEVKAIILDSSSRVHAPVLEEVLRHEHVHEDQ
mmetsp:Transcript_6900/g.19371  ORF Transcript_6900/g.19371 Transcript_6900/m.19371 type:complete len:239 (-) Transcript_6900:2256-2972(-)